MPDLKTEEPLWVQRMRARGYNIRVGTLDEPMSEIPEAYFEPPPRTLLNVARTVLYAIRHPFRFFFPR